MAGRDGSRPLSPAGSRLSVLALAAALPLPLASLPLFALGYWDKAEPLVVWFNLTAALASVAVAVALWRRKDAALVRVAHPYVLMPLVLGLWSLATAPFIAQPMLSLLGAPQSGFGGLWYFDFAALIAAARLAREDERGWLALGRLAMGVVLAVVAIKAWDWVSLRRGGGPLLIFVASYYGWMALALPVAVAGSDRRVALALAAAVAVVSQSLTAVGLLALGCAIVWTGHAGPGWTRKLVASRRVGAAAILAAAVVPLAALQWVAWLRLKESLRDRHLVHELVEAALRADPAGWLLGHGWGRTQDAFHTWLNVAGERLWSPTWTFLLSDYFHSHTWALESLYAAGLPGMLLTLGGFVVVPLFASASQRPLALAFAVTVTLFHGVWFQLCLSLPLMAMALAAVADDRWPRLGVLPARAVAAATALLAAAQAAAAVALLTAGLAVSHTRTALSAVPPIAMVPPPDFRGSDLPAAEVIRDSLAAFARRAASGEDPAPVASAVQAQLAEIDRRAGATRCPLLLTTGLSAMAAIRVTGELSFAAADGQMEMWRSWLERLLSLAPGRTDQAIPYFTALLAQHRFAEVADIASSLLARVPDDAVGLYYRGLTLVVQPEPAKKAAGLRLIRAAVNGGLERFMPIDPGLRSLLLQPSP